MITVEQLWAEKYAALAEAAEAEEGERRAEDFIDVTRTVCGVELRAMTPRDFLILDYAHNPLIHVGEVPRTAVAQFLWQMLAVQPAGWLSRRRFFRHCNGLDLAKSVEEIRAYLDRLFADAPEASGSASGAEGAPIGTHFVAPLIVRIATGIPGMGPREIMDTPLPQLFQYQKVLEAERARREGYTLRTRTLAHRLLCECLDEANRINAQAVSQEAAEIAEKTSEAEASATSAPSCKNL